MKCELSREVILQRLVELETAVTHKHPPTNGQSPFMHKQGRLPILLSAPHGTAHRRNGRVKAEEGFTSALARLVAAETGAHVLHTQYMTRSDPNYEPSAPYKTALRRIVQGYDIRFVLDIHGMSDRHKFGLALGTMNGRSCPNHESLILQTLQTHGFRPSTKAEVRQFDRLRWDRFVLNHSRFTGGVINHTVTKFVREKLDIAAAQIELCSSLRVVQSVTTDGRLVFVGDGVGIETAVHALIALVRPENAAGLQPRNGRPDHRQTFPGRSHSQTALRQCGPTPGSVRPARSKGWDNRVLIQ
jgi:hypothetical protein